MQCLSSSYQDSVCQCTLTSKHVTITQESDDTTWQHINHMEQNSSEYIFEENWNENWKNLGKIKKYLSESSWGFLFSEYLIQPDKNNWASDIYCLRISLCFHGYITALWTRIDGARWGSNTLLEGTSIQWAESQLHAQWRPTVIREIKHSKCASRSHWSGTLSQSQHFFLLFHANKTMTKVLQCNSG